MGVLRTVSAVLFIVSSIAGLTGLVCLFVIRQPAMGLACMGVALGVLLIALLIEAARQIARDMIEASREQSRLLRIVIGRRNKR